MINLCEIFIFIEFQCWRSTEAFDYQSLISPLMAETDKVSNWSLNFEIFSQIWGIQVSTKWLITISFFKFLKDFIEILILWKNFRFDLEFIKIVITEKSREVLYRTLLFLKDFFRRSRALSSRGLGKICEF